MVDRDQGTPHDRGYDVEVALGLKPWSIATTGSFDASRLRSILVTIAAGSFGGVDRIEARSCAAVGYVLCGVTIAVLETGGV